MLFCAEGHTSSSFFAYKLFQLRTLLNVATLFSLIVLLAVTDMRASVRQVASAQTPDSYCTVSYDGTTSVCDPLPSSLTVPFSSTLNGSKLILFATWSRLSWDGGPFLGSIGTCTDSLGQTWTSVGGLITPPPGASVEGITAVSCQTDFPNVPPSSSTNELGVLILHFYEVTGAGVGDNISSATTSCSVVPQTNTVTILADKSGVVQNYSSDPILGDFGVLGASSSGLITSVSDNPNYSTSGNLILTTIHATVGTEQTNSQISFPNATACLTVTIPQTVPGADDGTNLGKCDECESSAGEPINLTNGNVYITQRDYSLPGLAGGLKLERTWNSLWPSSPHAGVSTLRMFGDSWTSNFEERIVQVDGLNTVDYWRADGNKIRFTWTGWVANGTYLYTVSAPQQINAFLYYDSNTNHFYTLMGDDTYRYFSSAGYPTSTVDRHGNTTTFTYNGPQLVQVTDAASRALTFAYADPVNPNQVTSIQDAAGVIARYQYDSVGRVTRVTYADDSFNSFNYDQNSLILSVTDTDGKILEAHTYDPYRRGLTSERANGVEKLTVSYDASGGLASLTNSLGYVTQYSSTTLDRKNHVAGISGPGCVTCGGRGDHSFGLDSYGHRATSTDALGVTTQTSYSSNTLGLPDSHSVTVNGAPIRWSYTYTDNDKLGAITDPLGNVTTNNYTNPQGQIGHDLLSTTTPPPDSRTAASVTSFTYDTKGQLLTVTDPLLHVTTFAYTAAGLVQTVKDAQNKVTQFEYDLRGNRTALVDALNQRTTFDYDSMNRLTAIHYPTTPATSTTFSYDHRGRRTSVTDANNKTSVYEYDDADRLVTVTDAQQGVTRYEYDTENHLTKITDALLRDTLYEYDENGWLKKATFPSGKIETYEYDAVGNLIGKTDRKNQTITFAYDELRRLKHKQYPDGTAVDYTYDADSRLTQVTDPTGTYRYTYDNMGRLTQTSTTYSFIPNKTFPVGYGWDAASNLTSMTDPQNGTTTYTYDTLNRLSTLKNPQRNQFTFAYDALSRRTQLARPNSIKSNYAYDPLSRLTSLLHQFTTSKGVTTTLDGAAYTYDAAGNRLSRTDKRTNVTLNYGYDPLYELTSVMQGSSTTESYSFDAVGNRLNSLGISPYNYNSSNQLTDQPGVTYVYDDNGNLTSKTDASGITSYTWDYENRLTRVTLPGGAQVNFKYDPMGRRIQKSSAAGTVNYVYDGANVLEEVDNGANVLARYTHNLRVDEPLAELRSGTTSYYEPDALGSVTSLSNSSGALANTYTYDSFGKLTASSGTITNSYRYTAREYDAETGLYYYRARYYDSTIGRFISEDPLEFNGDGANFYAYVTNSPLDWFDETGEGKGRDRGRTGRPSGTDNQFKKLRPDPNDTTKVRWKDKDGKDHVGAKPPGFDEYWKKKHPEQCTEKPKADSKSEFNIEDFYCGPGRSGECIPRPSVNPLFPVLPVNPTVPSFPSLPVFGPEPAFFPI